MMAASTSASHPSWLKVAAILILCLQHVPSKTVGLGFPSFEVESMSMKEKEKLLGSRPPGCVNKCLSCRPCMATLTINDQLHQGNGSSHEGADDSYYLLSWKCKCGNKLFQP